MQATIDEEEDVSRGDVLDFITPREISRMRYEQHHEWMEEILESPYATKQIVPSELGLGRQGTLETFTDGFFVAPVSTSHEAVNGKVGKLAPGKAEEFTNHANAKLAEMQADLEKMKQQHIRRMEKLRRTTNLGSAERKMRNMNASDDGYKNVAAQVQELMGRKIDMVQKVERVAKGGLQDIKPVVQEPQPNLQQHMAAMQAQHQAQIQSPNQQQQQQVQQQQRTQQQMSPQSQQYQQSQSQQPQPQGQQQVQQTSQSTDQPKDQMQSQSQPQQSAEENDLQEAMVQPAHDDEIAKSQPTPDDADSQIQNNDALDAADIDMGDLGDDVGDDIGDENGDVNDWDMLNDQPSGENSQTPQTQTADQQQEQTPIDQQSPNDQPLDQPHQIETDTPVDTNDFDMVNDFDTNMDTAGDALADYGADEDLNLDDSAFGDAFHHNQQDMS